MNRMTQVGMGLMTLGLVGLLWKGPRGEEGGVKGVAEPVVEVVAETAEAKAESSTDQPPGVEEGVAKAAEGAAVKVAEVSGEGEADPAAVLAELRGNDVELVYQLGQDITELTPEGRARLKAEWEGQVGQDEVAGQ